MGDQFLSSAGTGGNCARPMRLPDPSPVLDKNRAPMGPEILSSTGRDSTNGAFAKRGARSPPKKLIWVCLAHLLRLSMLYGLTIVWAILLSRPAMPRKNNNSCSTCLYLSDNTSCSKYAESPVFLRGSADGNDVPAGILCLQQQDSKQRTCRCRTKNEHVHEGYPEKP